MQLTEQQNRDQQPNGQEHLFFRLELEGSQVQIHVRAKWLISLEGDGRQSMYILILC